MTFVTVTLRYTGNLFKICHSRKRLKRCSEGLRSSEVTIQTDIEETATHHPDILTKSRWGLIKTAGVITLKAELHHWAILLLQDLMSDDNKGECKATAEEKHHHAQQAPLVVHRKWQVL